MRYFKLHKVVTEHTTLDIVLSEGETKFPYSQTGNEIFVGVNTEDANFLTKQHSECEVTEHTFAEVEEELKNCQKMKDLNATIEAKIAKKYTLGEEIKMLKLAEADPERVVYQAYVDGIKAEIDMIKIARGLKQGN